MKIQKEGKPTGDARVNKVYRNRLVLLNADIAMKWNYEEYVDNGVAFIAK